MFTNLGVGCISRAVSVEGKKILRFEGRTNKQIDTATRNNMMKYFHVNYKHYIFSIIDILSQKFNGSDPADREKLIYWSIAVCWLT